jgi:FkbM family methyltransferase
MKGTIRPMARDLETGLVKVSGIEVLIAGEQNDLYFQQCLEQRSLFEPSVEIATRLLKTNPIILDIGASIGGVTSALAKYFVEGRVIAFEAAPSVHRSLRETVRLSNGGEITVIEKAAGSSAGSLMFHEDGNGSGWGFLADDLGAVQVDVVTIDDTVENLSLPTVDFIKIDVEGSEMAVLLGAQNTLSKFKPILIFEVNTFCLWRYGRTFPQDLIRWVRDRYQFTAAIFSDGSVTEIVDDATVNHLLHLVGSQGGLLDIVASPKPFIRKIENIHT